MESLFLFLLILFAVLALCVLLREGILKKPWLAVFCALMLAAAFSLRASVFDRVTGDYRDWLAVWVNYYRSNGGFRAFSQLPPYCNYHVPYLYFLALFSYAPAGADLYLIKLLSVFFDLIMAWAAMKLVGRVTDKPGLRAGSFFAVLFWPTVFLNGSLWGQCDSIYVAFLLLGLWLALEDRPILSLVMFALSFGFKLQAIFVLPIILVLWMCGKYNWKHLFTLPLAYLLLILPAVLLGRPFLETVLFYLNQTGSIGDGLNYNSASIYAFFWNLPEEQKDSAAAMGILGAAAYLLNLLAIAWVNRKRLSDRALLCLALLMAIGLPFLLPHMHDRYFFSADLLSLVLVFSMPAFFLTAPLVCYASFLGYYAYLSFYFSERGGHFLLTMDHGARALLGALALTALALAMSLREEKKKQPGGRKPARKKKAKA